jgi:hypothetical protein
VTLTSLKNDGRKKKGWLVCDKCGVSINAQDKEIIEEHVRGTGCERVRKLLGFSGRWDRDVKEPSEETAKKIKG